MKHLLITRLKYTSLEELKHRVELTNKTLVPNLQNQTYKEFTWALIINPEHKQYLSQSIKFPFIDFPDFESCFSYIQKEEVLIQSSIDSDEMVSNFYVQLIQETAEKYKNQKALVIHFQVLKFFINHNVIERRHFQYNQRTVSMFYSIYQPKPVIPFYIDTHDKLAKYASQVICLPVGDAFWVHHDDNIHRAPTKKHIVDLKFDKDLKQ